MNTRLISKKEARYIGENVESVLDQAVANRNSTDIELLTLTVQALWPFAEWAAKQSCHECGHVRKVVHSQCKGIPCRARRLKSQTREFKE